MLSSEPPVSGDGGVSIQYSVFSFRCSGRVDFPGALHRPQNPKRGCRWWGLPPTGTEPGMLVHALMVAVVLSTVRCARNALHRSRNQSAGVGGGICLLA